MSLLGKWGKQICCCWLLILILKSLEILWPSPQKWISKVNSMCGVPCWIEVHEHGSLRNERHRRYRNMEPLVRERFAYSNNTRDWIVPGLRACTMSPLGWVSAATGVFKESLLQNLSWNGNNLRFSIGIWWSTLVGGLEQPSILNVPRNIGNFDYIIPIDELISFRGVAQPNHPPEEADLGLPDLSDPWNSHDSAE